MEYKDVVLKIADFEQRYDVNALQVKGVHIWPLIRVPLVSRIVATNFSFINNKDKTPSTVVPPPSTPLISLVTRIGNAVKLANVWKLYQTLNAVDNQQPVDVMAVTRVVDHTSLIDDKYHSFYVDPVLDLAGKRYSTNKLEFIETDKDQRQPRYQQPVFVDPYQLLRFSRVKHLFDSAEPDRRELSSLSESLAAEFDVVISVEELREKISLFRQYTDVYKIILSRHKPRAVIFKQYYAWQNMSCICACRQLGIKTVDINHGSGRYHPAYTHWSQIPAEGYQILPDYFWVWGPSWAKNIRQTNKDNGQIHKPIVGGHRWLGQNIEENIFTIDDTSFLKRLETADKVILVTFSSIATDENIPEHLFQTMTNTPKSWLWLLRLHPLRQNPTYVDRLRSRLEVTEASHEMRLASQLPLPLLLKHSDHHITMYSHTVFEALGMNVPSTVIHPIALTTFESWIEKNTFAYADSATKLTELLNNPLPSQYATKEEIEVSADAALRALATILEEQ